MKEQTDNKNTLLVVRMKAAEKAALKTLVKQRGITLSSLVLSCLANKKIPDHSARLQLLEGVGRLVKEMNAIGNNINQATMAIHLIKNGKRIASGEYRQFTHAVAQYRVEEKQIKILLQQLLYDEPGI